MINYDLSKIRALCFDVDGVLSMDTVQTDAEGLLLRTVNNKDGYALQLAVRSGLHVAIITGGRSETIRRHYEMLGITDVMLAQAHKTEALADVLQRYNLHPESVLYMGDDIPDYEVMQQVGLPCCPADAAAEIRGISRYVSHRNGGCGCVRDVVEQVLKAQGKWMADAEAFRW